LKSSPLRYSVLAWAAVAQPLVEQVEPPRSLVEVVHWMASSVSTFWIRLDSLLPPVFSVKLLQNSDAASQNVVGSRWWHLCSQHSDCDLWVCHEHPNVDLDNRQLLHHWGSVFDLESWMQLMWLM